MEDQRLQMLTPKHLKEKESTRKRQKSYQRHWTEFGFESKICVGKKKGTEGSISHPLTGAWA